MKNTLVLAVAALSPIASASVNLLSSRSDLTPDSDLVISDFGANFSVVPSGTGKMTTGASPINVIVTSPVAMERRDQGSGWVGFFPDAENLIYVQDKGGQAAFSLSAVQAAFGLEIDRDEFLPYHVKLDVLGAAGLLDSFDVQGNFGTPTFLGARSTDEDIAGFAITVIDDTGAETDFAFNHVSFESPTSVPEPFTMGVLAGAMALVARRRAGKS